MLLKKYETLKLLVTDKLLVSTKNVCRRPATFEGGSMETPMKSAAKLKGDAWFYGSTI